MAQFVNLNSKLINILIGCRMKNKITFTTLVFALFFSVGDLYSQNFTAEGRLVTVYTTAEGTDLRLTKTNQLIYRPERVKVRFKASKSFKNDL